MTKLGFILNFLTVVFAFYGVGCAAINIGKMFQRWTQAIDELLEQRKERKIMHQICRLCNTYYYNDHIHTCTK